MGRLLSVGVIREGFREDLDLAETFKDGQKKEARRETAF